MSKATIIFDVDDTLWSAQPIYDTVLNEFAEWCISRVKGVTKEEIRDSIDKTQEGLAKTEGFSFTTFTEPYIRFYQSLLIKQLSQPTVDEIIHIYNMVTKVYTTNIELYPDVKEVISTLIGEGYNIVVLTVGDKVMQSAKLMASGIYNFIDSYYIVTHKNVDIMQQMKERYGDHTIMVGNSKRSDINPAIKAGLHAIYIPCKTWGYDEEELVKSDHIHIAESLIDVPRIVKEIHGV